MILASMINLSEYALICDFAETYHIFDYRSLPVKLAATLSAGLRDDSRSKMIMADIPVPPDTSSQPLRTGSSCSVAVFRARTKTLRCRWSNCSVTGTQRKRIRAWPVSGPRQSSKLPALASFQT